MSTGIVNNITPRSPQKWPQIKFTVPDEMSGKSSLIELDDIPPRIKMVLDAWLKFGTVFLVYRVCTFMFFERGKPGAKFFDKEHTRMAILILLGFALYYAVVAPALPKSFNVHPVVEKVANDTIMFGTVLVSSHVMESLLGGDKLMNKQWLKTAGVILLIFAAYQVLLHPFIPFNKLSPNAQPVVQDMAKYGVFLILLRVLCKQNLMDSSWILSTLFVLFGFGVYHLATKRVIKVNSGI